MIQTIRSAWKVQELRNKLLFTIFALLIFRVGSAIPVPFIDTESLKTYMASQSSSIFGLLNVMSGDAFAQATVFALSIQPYINSSIIVQLLTIAIPALEKMARDEGEEGKKKIAAITRYATVAIALLQAFGYYKLISYYELVADGLWPAFVIIFAFTAGSAFLMWLGEQITEFGVGNGISIILFGGIIARGPHMVSSMINGVRVWASGSTSTTTASLHPAFIPLILVGILLLVVFIVFITNSERRVPVQYAKRVVGRKMYGGQSSHIPIKVNMSGVMPIIFAQAIASIPATIGMFVPSAQTEGSGWNTFLKVFDSNGLIYCVVYFLLIIVFSYFYNTIQFNPVEIANNLKKNGGFVPGFRPGKPTADFLARVINRLTMFGAIYLAVVALLPAITGNIMLAFGSSAGNSLAIGGTSIIIVVGVALETVKVLEAQLMMRHYKGFLE
ncbi:MULTISPECIES: preprotein translocase subunit SecY [unclassified Pseudoflavonifractor]|uniref:preprotein translocase subunit SecY n=1 Tax=unclassified Pseudoflavonifractor TaxID=2628103 RepID=UPI000B36A9B5|nr:MULTISPECIES: preprotein translocase subunit SecY [unclassified Pseudoflavonifractor]OUN95903.1 preprotein translocase subunit SecY [Pseudoflavonifractor sp. An44]OUP44911.1 preprotein translocase subunit SecY [Pseudoflavonifractor sp. An187]